MQFRAHEGGGGGLVLWGQGLIFLSFSLLVNFALSVGVPWDSMPSGKLSTGLWTIQLLFQALPLNY